MFWNVPSELEFGQQAVRDQMDFDGPLLESLSKSGFRRNSGLGDAGIYMSYLQRGGGFYIDLGASIMIIEGKIKELHSLKGTATEELVGGRSAKEEVLPAFDLPSKPIPLSGIPSLSLAGVPQVSRDKRGR
ncbi:hypothetical protein Asppvi_001693 [Aspergillus pseudoviridinutans]|uniref:Uncharacterized protein n=1 Tax=Aspergillus pseudoviridinutans TaxID=1517512 RepID=A0A9P3B810_9EURO|nr:uncharacterized protein Asppvi_001693 [Aspergillus pseudoviridinutans]GIJ83174.1 hypothetical protein Asppvi_001693 [Aspergillus pseudoviridinutans]